MLLDYFRRLLEDEEAILAELKARTTVYPSLTIEIARRGGRVEAYKEFLEFFKDCQLCRDGFINHKHLG